MFSAIKVGGERMYEKARRGESIELSPRHISIFQFDIERSLEDRQNLNFWVTCSKGTYIQSLCVNLGKALGSWMTAAPNDVEYEASKFLQKLIQESTDDKLATKLYVILQHMKASEKENSMSYQIISKTSFPK